MSSRKPIIIISDSGLALESEFLKRLRGLTVRELETTLKQPRSSGICELSTTVKLADEILERELYCVEERKCYQPTNPHFGKEKWKKNRKS